jgi:hypothetical protein
MRKHQLRESNPNWLDSRNWLTRKKWEIFGSLSDFLKRKIRLKTQISKSSNGNLDLPQLAQSKKQNPTTITAAGLLFTILNFLGNN